MPARKIKLTMEDLEVVSFVTHPTTRRTGTVKAYETEGGWSCDGTCGESQWGLCGGTGALSGCCGGTGTCTQDPANAYCYDSVNMCYPSRYETCLEGCVSGDTAC